jgi:hypothetical protein
VTCKRKKGKGGEGKWNDEIALTGVFILPFF